MAFYEYFFLVVGLSLESAPMYFKLGAHAQHAIIHRKETYGRLVFLGPG
jgi:hypothetical protein